MTETTFPNELLVSQARSLALERLAREPLFVHGSAPLAAEPVFMKNVRDGLRPRAEIGDDGIAAVQVFGRLANRPHPVELMQGFEDTAAAAEVVRELDQNPKVRGILLNWDSPGGYVTGGPEFGEAIRDSRRPVVSWTGGMMASLAYWIASQSSAVYASESALVGSIGCYNVVPDFSKAYEAAGVKVEVFRNREAVFKSAGVPGTSLTDEQRKHLAESSQRWFDLFKADVLSKRPQVKAEAMRGQVLSGGDAKAAGLIDAVGGLAFARSVLKHRL